MGQVLHGSGTTTEAVRRAIQNSQESLRALSRQYGINQKTVAKWKKRTSQSDLPTGPKEPRSTVLSPEEEAVIVAFRRHTVLPLDDCLYALQPTIPHLTRSSLHRCHIDIAELRYEGDKGFLFVAVDRTSKRVFARIYRKATKLAAAGFLKSLIRTVPYRIHTILTDIGVQFIQREQGTSLTFLHIFGRVALENGIEHRLTKPYHPWTNGQAERMVRTIKEATVKSFHYSSINQMRRHVGDWLTAYNFAKQLKAWKFKTPYEAIQELWKSKPEAFSVKPHHHMLGPNRVFDPTV